MCGPSSPFRRRRAVAAVELAITMPFLLIVLVGIWEVGRMVHVQQLLNNAAREGARVASQGITINRDSDPTEIMVHSGTPSVEGAVTNYLREAGIDTTDMQVTFTYLDGDTSLTEPHQAVKGQRFRVYVSLPFNNVRWSLLSNTGITTLNASTDWRSLVDEPFSLDTTIPNW